jgi:hypothetical protein
VEPWRFCARHMKEHRDDCDDIAAGRALIEKLGEIA